MNHLLATLCAACLLLLSTAGTRAAQPVIISEFMASNTRVISDEDGEFADWIEIHNRGASPVDLEGWSLTDTSSSLRLWQFPSTNLPPGGYMLVFASGKDRRSPGTPLHTNFRLGADGEYLALVEPDGATIATSFSPYPRQLPNVSYGLGVIVSNQTLISASSPLRAFVPTVSNGGNSLGDSWKQPGFNDSAWASGNGSAGFFTGSAAVTASDNLLVHFNFDSTPAANVIDNTGSEGDLHDGVNRGPVWHASSSDSATPAVTRYGAMEFHAATNHQITIPAHANFSLSSGAISFWMRSAGISDPGGSGAILFDRMVGLNGLIIVQRDDGRIQVQPGTNVNTLLSQGIVSDDRWHHVAVTFEQSAGGGMSLYIDGNLSASGTNRIAWSWPSTAQIEIGRSHTTTWRRFNGALDDFRIYNSALTPAQVSQIAAGDGGIAPAEIGLDLRTAMHSVNPSAFIRVPFNVPDTNAVTFLQLRLKYDDGYIAFINGQEVSRANAPETALWNSGATETHSSSRGEEVLIGVPEGLLRQGANVLAIQGLNRSASDNSFLVAPELIATHVAQETSRELFFTGPTPGQANTIGAQTPGPIISDVEHSPHVPQEDDGLVVTARVTNSFHPVADVILRYRVMFSQEVAVPMVDDGQNNDGLAGDGLYGAVIPANVSTNGQMLRYFISATDNQGTSSRWPLFLDRLNSAEYLGTVVSPDSVVSKLPVFHFFVAPSEIGRVDTQAGGRASVFHDGEFYDNVQMQLRGNSTSGYTKKSHRVEFNREHPLRHSGPGEPIRKTSFVADFPDPTYMRQGLSFWLADLMGAPAPFYEPVRLQLNGQFYQLANHNDVHGEELLERLGFDPNGALYNAAGQVTPGKASTGGFEKKTRRWETGDPDYLLLANSIRENLPLPTRATNLFDMLDLPEVINYMAVARFVHENDDVWANMSLYHDNDGDDLWRIIPFDMNLSWGAAFLDSGAGGVEDRIQNTNDLHKSFPMYGSGAAVALTSGNYNRMYDAIFRVPQTREMFLRRMRTLLDTYVLPPGTPPGASPIEQKILAWRDYIAEEAALDRARWGWPAKGGQSNFDPGIHLYPGVEQLIEQFFYERRNHFYLKHSVLNTGLTVGINKNQNAGIPTPQPSDAVLKVFKFDYRPDSGNSGHEYIILTNPQPHSIDISGWQLEGAVDFTFAPGTVVLGTNVIVVTPSLKDFRTRTEVPKRGMGLFVVGEYQGQLSARGETIRVLDAHGRLVDSLQYNGNPSPAQQSLRITEIMYNPGSAESSQDLEFIELKNIGSTPLDLAGVHFSAGISFSFGAGATLAPGATTVLVRNQAAFSARYPSVQNIAGQFSGALDSNGERIALRDANGETILDFEYDNTWHKITDGHGFSLVVSNDAAPYADWDLPTNWRPSASSGGSPGATDPAPPQFPLVLVNELLTNGQGPDTVELYNPGSTPADISGWYLSDDYGAPNKYRFPAGTIIQPNSYLVRSQVDFPGLAFSANGDDEVLLFSANANGELTGYLHGFAFGAAEREFTFGRHLTSTGEEVFVAQSQRTFDAQNAGPKTGPVIFTELFYHAPFLTQSGFEPEFIELHNNTDSVVLLNANSVDAWKLIGGVDFTFPPNSSIPAQGYALAVNFDPSNPALVQQFWASFPGYVPPQTQLFGPFSGNISEQGERIQLVRGTAEILVDEIRYSEDSPWPSIADGHGPSMVRRIYSAYGNDPANWTAATPSPGSPYSRQGVTITAHPASQQVNALDSVTLQVTAQSAGTLHYQWLKNGEPIPGATSSALSFNNAQVTDTGLYSVVVMDSSSAVESNPAFLEVTQGSYFAVQPVVRNALSGASISLSVSGYGAGDRSFTWLRNGQAIPGAPNAPTLTLQNAQPSDTGLYTARVQDANGETISGFSEVNIVEKPVITRQPQDIVALEGEEVRFTVSAAGTLPMNFRWRRGAAVLTNQFSADGESTFILRNVTLAQAGLYSVQVTNVAVTLAAPATVTATSSNAVLTVLADADRDGMADTWEQEHGFSFSDPNDAALDFDQDGVSNRDEYRAGTDPKNPADGRITLVHSLNAQGQLVLSFHAAPNQSYAILTADSVTSPSWQTLQTVPAQPTARSESISISPAGPPKFFRIVSPAR